ncbi:MAG: cardiolipin synthase [Pyrinomonadaceae bacterium]|nr:cardiolipin synthase [Phycisphaerales bacterium]
MHDFSWYAAVVYGCEWLFRLCLVGVVIMRRRPMPTTLAWVTVLLLLPIVGTMAYLMIGENRLGSRRIRKYRELTAGMEQQAVKLWKHRHYDWSGENAAYQHIWQLATNESGLPPLEGNSVRLIASSDTFLSDLVADIDGSQSHCHLLFYIYTTSPKCWAVSEALMRAARRGVACRLLVDGVGSKQFLRSEYVRRLRHAGVQVVAALPVSPLRVLLSRIDLRNHRKIVVIDGRIAYAGSQNLTDDTFRAGWNRKVGPWIDAMVRVKGPAAQALSVVFLQDWQSDSDEEVADIAPFLPELPPKGDSGSVIQVLPSGPGESPESILQLFVTTLFAAREELIISTPYFVPDESTRRALQAAALRGVAVTIIMPQQANSPVLAAASRSQWESLLECGVRIRLFQGGLLHSKTLTVDRKIALIGSANLDQRSFWLNFEVTLIHYDDDFASELRFLQTSYLEQSEEVHLDEWRARPKYQVLFDNAAQLLGPLL